MGKRTTMLLLAASTAMVANCETQSRPTSHQPTELERQAQEACATEPASKLRAVLRQLHRQNEAEVRLGNLASDRTMAPSVTKFANEMVNERTTLDEKLLDLARRERLEIGAVPAADPIHAAAIRLVLDDEGALESTSPKDFDVAYVTAQSERHNFAMKIIDEGLKVATGDIKSLLDSAREAASRHRDEALLLMEDLHFPSRAIGGGPVSPPVNPGKRETLRDDAAKSPTRGRSGSTPDKSRVQDKSSVEDKPRFDRLGMDGGVWPPITTPPDIMRDPR
jgi:predicted outer membrane protein